MDQKKAYYDVVENISFRKAHPTRNTVLAGGQVLLTAEESEVGLRLNLLKESKTQAYPTADKLFELVELPVKKEDDPPAELREVAPPAIKKANTRLATPVQKKKSSD